MSRGVKNSRTQGLKDSRTQGLKDSRTQGLKDSRTQEEPTTWCRVRHRAMSGKGWSLRLRSWGTQARCAEKQSYFPGRRYADTPTRFLPSRLGSKQTFQSRGRTLPPHLSQ